MNIQVQVDGSYLLSRMRNGQKRLAYSVINALNKTGKEMQRAIQKRTLATFTVRQKPFITRQVAKIEKTSFANVRRGQAWIEIEVGRVKSGNRELLLSQFEAGGVREPFVGKSIAVPVIGGPARPTRQRKVPRAWTFETLNFQHTTTRTGKTVWVSNNRKAYMVRGVGVFESRPGRESRLAYSFQPRVALDQRLRFVETARVTALRRWSKNMGQEIGQALARAAREATGR